MSAKTKVSALDYAIFSRDICDGQLVHHSDYAEVCVKPRMCDYAEVCVKPRMCGDGLRSWGLLVDFSA